MSTQTAAREIIPTDPTPADFRRLAALVTLERHRVDPKSLWHQDDVAAQLWDTKRFMNFPILAHHGMAVARDTQFKGPGAIYLIAAGVIEP